MKCGVMVLQANKYNCLLNHLLEMDISEGKIFNNLTYEIHGNFSRCLNLGQLSDKVLLLLCQHISYFTLG